MAEDLLQANPSARMSREVREAEPIHVSRGALGLAAIGLLVAGIACLVLWRNPGGTRLAWILLTVGLLAVAAAVLGHLEHHRARFGAAASSVIALGIILYSLAWAQFAIRPSWYSSPGRWQVAWGCTGLSLILMTLGVFLVIARKESRLLAADKTAETEIHASFFQLTMLSVGLLLSGLGPIGLAFTLGGTGTSGLRASQFLGWLIVAGAAFVAVALIAHVEHLTVRLGRPAVIVTIAAPVVYCLSNLPSVSAQLASSATWGPFLWWGAWGISMLLGAVACVLVVFHKQARTSAA